MLKKIVASWYFRRNEFVKLLAPDMQNKLTPHKKIWAYYKLGIYSKVIELKGDLEDWRILLAKIVSHTALGNKKDAKLLYEKWIMKSSNKQHNILLAKDLLPYIPQKSFELLDPKDEPVLYSALLVRLNHLPEAKKYIEQLLKQKVQKKNFEILLHYSNAINCDNYAKLKLFNEYLVEFGLHKLQMKDNNLPYSVANITSDYRKMIQRDELISIIMTAYNSEQTIAIAIESILKQSYLNFELIIVDDASDDDTLMIIQKYMDIDSRIKVMQLKENIGTYRARNIALKEAKGEFVTFHDSDDYSLPVKLENQVLPLLKDIKLIASVSNWIRLSTNGMYYARSVYPLLRLNHSSLLFRKKKVIEKVGYFDNVRTGADSEFFTRLILVFNRKAIIRIKQPLSLGSHRENSLMTAKDTGYNEAGISSQRQEYWEKWNTWHIKNQNKLYKEQK
ncbi:putative glycosyltransferase [hydrothermal vent metagenome]|uniref:Putative glycosyltransferase n=1 Tax=hydrothermal vent metagenome TaxID=652676 RepID=A0A1W1BVG0_9ZZZZ